MVRTLVVDDSVTARALIVAVLKTDPGIEIVGQARNAEEALELARRLRPDVITMLTAPRSFASAHSICPATSRLAASAESKAARFSRACRTTRG